ncbi:alpha-amylase family glycosyl hydrolase [Frigidibacter oleivorans]|uniref:alpha-amylase family glycosyl hydrolase n=1 Tax=Frigidibacter oleivorans TaxID=2487129 RepID=UPI000F8DA15F|nr:alpha-amylase family glycosyl hydrolase [Frigidibacter oleivorans]
MTEWWRSAVIYQIYPRSFQDDNGDGVGDLAGITRRLDHVADLGCDAIWLSPIFPSPMEDMGYDVSDYTGIEPLFGTLADFDALIARAHDLGLKVIIDQVISHSSDRHPWFVESRSSRENPRADWYVWADPKPDGNPPNNWLSVFGGSSWTWDAGRRQYYLHNFLDSQPDLNLHTPAVQQALLDAMRFWLERGVDGFRLDTVNYYFHDDRLRDNPGLPRKPGVLPPVNPYDMQEHLFSKTRPENIAFLKRLRALTDSFPDRMMVGEVGDALRSVQIMGEYTKGGDRLHMAYSFEMLGPDYTPAHFRKVIEGFFTGAPQGWPCWSFSNHDVNRHVSRWSPHDAGGDALARQAAALILSFEGAICLYQGEELGQTETDILWEELTDPVGLRFWPDNKGRDGCRTPMVWDRDGHAAGFSTAEPWLPVKPPQRARAVSEQAGKAGSVLEAYRAMLAFRRATPALTGRGTRFLDLPEPLLGFVRGEGAGAVTCLFNLSAKPAKLPKSAPGGVAIGPAQGVETAGRLGPNGYVFLRGAG